jgi:hypothetical protein
MHRKFNAAGVLVMSFTIVALAQAKPNFGGKWALTSPDAASVGMNPTSMTVTHDDKTFVIASTGQMGEIKTVFNLDGTSAKSPLEIQGMSIDRVTKSAWDGNKLVLTTVSDFQGQSFETKQIWALGTDGTLTIDSTRPDFQGGGAPVTTKLVYKKQ